VVQPLGSVNNVTRGLEARSVPLGALSAFFPFKLEAVGLELAPKSSRNAITALSRESGRRAWGAILPALTDKISHTALVMFVWSFFPGVDFLFLQGK
jgi:hypothetical protein